MKSKIHLLASGIGLLGLGACFSSAYDNVGITAAPAMQTACLGSVCDSCSRVDASIGAPGIVADSAEYRALNYYLDSASDSLKHRINLTYAGYYLGLTKVDLSEQFSLLGSSLQPLSRKGVPVNNYFAVRTRTAITLPMDDHPQANFIRSQVENADFRIILVAEGAHNIKQINSDGTRTSLAKQETHSDGATVVCLPATYNLSGTEEIPLEIDWVIADRDPTLPAKNGAMAFYFTAAAAPNQNLCGQKVWHLDDSRRPSSGAEQGIVFDDLLANGILSIPKEMQQTTTESRQQNANFRACSVTE